MPPGPRLPRVLQTAGFMFGAPRFLEACRRRYGNAVTFRTLFDSPFVMLFDPALVKELFQGSSEQLHAGEANALLAPVVGQRSVLLLDGAKHLRHRKLMLPSFHGRRLQAYAEVITESADTEIEEWPVGQPFALLPRMQSLTLRVIMRAVFGYRDGAEEQALQRALRAMIDPLSRPRGMMLLAALGRFADGAIARRFEGARQGVDEILLAEIARRREDPRLGEREDVFSALLVAQDEHGGRLSDQEVRDELVTLLLAGHETTATGLAWTFDLLLHAPAVHTQALQRDAEYLDAVVKESLRIRPVIPAVGRVVRGEPLRLGGYVVPPGVEINPSIRVIQRREELYRDAPAFRPERFLAGDAPDTYTWLPFGGGTRRCLGASFAQMEIRIVLERVLSRCALRAGRRELEKAQLRAITLVPRDGVMVVQDRPPHASRCVEPPGAAGRQAS
ncbi:MAG: cytochrome P450 [Actinomycetota bacterium]|nr:cytochrome P450 [Actinomycetota bacterium]